MERDEGVGGKDRAVFVTGISSGIGRAIALELAAEGRLVFGTVRREEDRSALLELGGPKLIPLVYDLNERKELPALLKTVEAELERRGEKGLFALINNAGGSMVGPIELADVDELSRQFDARVAGSVALVQAFLPSIRRAGGRILWIATPGTMPTPWVAGIHAADFAINCVARTLALELGSEGPPVILIRCGGVRTRAGMATRKELEAALERVDPERRRRYESRLASWIASMEAFDAKRVDAEGVARLVDRVLGTPRPKARYRIGYMAGAAAFLESLPQVLTDRILMARFAK
ncbi:MAG TPA: SDR family NAD(P)-dependent oxidoreductase [Rectinemataceae bacterium]|nr:SDR family NAD(P)-dependent oxidoreductase [Rectinemataceae bacterium]